MPSIRTLGLVALIVVASCAESRIPSEESSDLSKTEMLVTDPGWTNRISGSPDTRLIALPPNLSSYRDAWVYQFGDYYKDDMAYDRWVAAGFGSNMECGPACVQMIEKLSGKESVACDYRKVVPGCEKYPRVHTECRAVGACGKFAAGIGFDDNSFDGLVVGQMRTVLESLGYGVKTYHEEGTRVNLAIVKNAINEDHPIIVALSPKFYASEVYSKKITTDSHFVVVVGYGSTCKNNTVDSSAAGAKNKGYVYILDPGWKEGTMICISEEAFNIALEQEHNPSTYTGIEVIRPGMSGSTKATWYPPGTLLSVEGEYYVVMNPDDRGFMQIRHASSRALVANRIPIDRAISVPKNVVACGKSPGEMDTAMRFREYRDDQTGAIYLVDLVSRTRGAFINYDAYLSYSGVEEWKVETAAGAAEWSSYPYTGLIGLAPGTLVKTDKAGVSTVWVVSQNASGRRLRLPIANEQAAKSYGYDLSLFGKNARAAVTVPFQDLDAVAGYEGQLLTEEMSLDCSASRCLAANGCFSGSSNTGGGGEEDLVGDGACGDCSVDASASTTSSTAAAVTTLSCDPTIAEPCTCSTGVTGKRWWRADCSGYNECICAASTAAVSSVTGTGGTSSVTSANPSTGGYVSSVSSVTTGGTPATVAPAGNATSVLTVGISTDAKNLTNSTTAVVPASSGTTSTSTSFVLKYESPIAGAISLSGWWRNPDGTNREWNPITECVDTNVNDRMLECVLPIRSGSSTFEFQVNLSDGRFWGDQSCSPNGGCGKSIGILTLLKGNQSVGYEMKVNNTKGEPYYNGFVALVP